MANKIRGEVEIKLGGESVILRPAFHGLAELEDRAGKGLLGIAVDLSKQNLGIKTIVAIIFGGMVGAGSKRSFEEIAELVVKEGAFNYIRPCMEFLNLAVQGQKKEVDEDIDPKK